MRQQFKPVSHSLGKSLSLLGFSGKQVVWLGMIFFLTFFPFLLASVIFKLSIYPGLCVAIWAALTCTFLSGAKPYKFWSKIYPPRPYWVRGQARYTSPISKVRLGVKKVKR
jgi:hypothetical protein